MDQKQNIIEIIASRQNIPLRGVAGVVSLLDDGSTIPFISRYRKETTGGLDEEQVGAVKQQYEKLTELLKRRETILSTIREQGKLTEEIRGRIEGCFDPVELEDLYLPYKPKRRTKATVARERGLEPLAAMLMRQDGSKPHSLAARFVKGEVDDEDAALWGACDIIAEWVSERERSRSAMRRLFSREATLVSKVVKGKETEGSKYSDYFDRSEPLGRVPSHRLLALLRGEREGILRLTAVPDEEKALQQLETIFLKGPSPAGEYIREAVKDGYRRLLRPSMETEALGAARERADTEAIGVFASNLRQLLLSPPLGQKRVLALDPGFRSGCKVVCLDRQGSLIHSETIYPHPPQNETDKARLRLREMVARFSVEAIAVGDGTAGRETEMLVRSLGLPEDVQVFMVSEDGASVYSASAAAREEFPDYDVTVRGGPSR